MTHTQARKHEDMQLCENPQNTQRDMRTFRTNVNVMQQCMKFYIKRHTDGKRSERDFAALSCSQPSGTCICVHTQILLFPSRKRCAFSSESRTQGFLAVYSQQALKYFCKHRCHSSLDGDAISAHRHSFLKLFFLFTSPKSVFDVARMQRFCSIRNRAICSQSINTRRKTHTPLTKHLAAWDSSLPFTDKRLVCLYDRISFLAASWLVFASSAPRPIK